MTYISKDYTSVKYAKAEGEKNILSNAACSCLVSLHACNHFQSAISSYYCIHSICSFFFCISFLSEVMQGISGSWNLCHGIQTLVQNWKMTLTFVFWQLYTYYSTKQSKVAGKHWQVNWLIFSIIDWSLTVEIALLKQELLELKTSSLWLQ